MSKFVENTVSLIALALVFVGNILRRIALWLFMRYHWLCRYCSNANPNTNKVCACGIDRRVQPRCIHCGIGVDYFATSDCVDGVEHSNAEGA